MIFCILPLLAALILSASSAVFSVVGLSEIFSAAKMSIIIMGASLEFAKIVTTAWTHRYWHNKYLHSLMKSYLVLSIIVLMLITSMGIFGRLSEAHTSDVASSSQIQIKIDRIDQQIQSEQNIIDRSTKQLNSLDRSLDVYFNKDKASQGLKARSQQEPERKELNVSVSDSQKKIDDLRNDLLPLQTSITDQAEKVGPVRYIAELIFSDPKTNIDNAVRIVILMIIFVFDPLALLLIIASSISFKEYNESKKTLTIPPVPDTIKKVDDAPVTLLNVEPEILPVVDNNIITEEVKDTFIPNESYEKETHAIDNPVKNGINRMRHWGYGKPNSKKV